MLKWQVVQRKSTDVFIYWVQIQVNQDAGTRQVASVDYKALYYRRYVILFINDLIFFLENYLFLQNTRLFTLIEAKDDVK